MACGSLREKGMIDEVVVVKCCICGLERKTKRTATGAARAPKGWKNHTGQLYCPDDWRKKHVLRAITMLVASPGNGSDSSWKDFRAELKTMWAATTQACNWMSTELYAQDVRRNGEDKMPPMARVYLYPKTRLRFPSLPAQTVAALENTVQAKYRAKRYDVIWRCAATLASYRYPTPFPIPNQGWTASIENEHPVVRARIGELLWELRLKASARFRRQLNAFRQIANGEAIQGEMALMESGKDVACKLVAWFPRRAQATRTGTLVVRSGSENILIALNEKDEKLWVYNGDQLPRWAAEHRDQLRRWSEDQKAEHRPVPPFAERRGHAATKYNQRMASAWQAPAMRSPQCWSATPTAGALRPSAGMIPIRASHRSSHGFVCASSFARNRTRSASRSNTPRLFRRLKKPRDRSRTIRGKVKNRFRSFSATDRPSAINGGYACRSSRSRKAVKHPGYSALRAGRPGSDH
jgi:hypothetical protein